MNKSIDLAKTLNSLPLLRSWGLPLDIGKACLVATFKNLARLPDYLQMRPNLSVYGIFVLDAPRNFREEISLGEKHGGNVPLRSMEGIGNFPQYAKVFMYPDSPALNFFCRQMAAAGIQQIWLDGVWPPTFGFRAPQPDFYAKNADKLSQVCSMFEDSEDRLVYAARIKSIISGNAGYMPVSPFMEYQHPVILPEAGDVMIDGGLSDMVWAQEDFAKRVGEAGRIIGFEPIAWMAEKAAATLAPFSQYKVVHAGLADRAGKANFASLRDSSHICSESAAGETEVCPLVTIDEAVEAEHLEKVDCIKLDIEGAELAALRGASKTIAKYRPKLIICLYHKPEDMIDIPLYIKNLEPEYKLHAAHSSCDFTDTIMYASMN